MDITILVTIVAGLVVALLFGLLFLKTRGTGEKREPQPRQGVPGPRRAVGGRNARARLRAVVAARQNEQDEEEEDDDDGRAGRAEDLDVDGKIGAKKRAKLEAKAERKAQREFQERKREDDKKKNEKLEEERRKAEEKEKQEEQKQLEEERRIREEKAKREHEEYLKMKEQFTVEEEGFEEVQDDDEGNVLQKFITYIKDNKVIILEDLATHFKLKTQNVIDRITTLQNEGILTGVVDDRGKFIYISEEELKAVAKFVNQRGRVSLVELVENSNRLIDITPKISVCE